MGVPAARCLQHAEEHVERGCLCGGQPQSRSSAKESLQGRAPGHSEGGSVDSLWKIRGARETYAREWGACSFGKTA